MAKMVAKINEIGPSKVSKHIADPMVLNVIDISPGSITNKKAFEEAVNKRGYRMFKPPADPAYHIEITQTQLNLHY